MGILANRGPRGRSAAVGSVNVVRGQMRQRGHPHTAHRLAHDPARPPLSTHSLFVLRTYRALPEATTTTATTTGCRHCSSEWPAYWVAI